MGMEIEERFWSKVDWNPSEPDRCWPYTDFVNPKGYGQFYITDITGKQFTARAHRLAYELEEGPIPKDFDIDHLCHDPKVCKLSNDCPHRRCCNLAHMKPVPHEENCAPDRRAHYNSVKTHCKRGHPYSYTSPAGSRTCRICLTDNQREKRRLKKQQ